jgi:sec-independent protein translocase protein TatA
MLGGLRGWEWVILAIVVVGIFGLPKLPSVAKSIGKSLRILRDEAKGVTDDAEGGVAEGKSSGKSGGKSGDDTARGKA